ncbi:Oidioi.mRNA.OKI2018_I69.chr2.g5293.t1.cds [Oikopleura dioica]|uniref:Oidioi.mRNA.OKI2018_I69.chr2.g5293.t1.cds n=1 Tax=Oikopleura dioica TaxID=34765 RepID=A0ABN7T5J3_OIKDI|nr:Oidioi.mRNA.OKI2018_I69.chr2.g5293.t1.cds [Oikopleura dioica]
MVLRMSENEYLSPQVDCLNLTDTLKNAKINPKQPKRSIQKISEDDFCSIRFSSSDVFQLNFEDAEICEKIEESPDYLKIEKVGCKIFVFANEVNFKFPAQISSIEISILPLSNSDFSSYSESRLRRATFAAQRSNDDSVASGPDEKTLDWAVYIVVFVLVILPVGAIFYCACQSQMHAATHGITASQRASETTIGATGKTISQQPITTVG